MSIHINDSYHMKNWYIMGDFRLLSVFIHIPCNTMQVLWLKVLQGLSYKVCSVVLAKFSQFGKLISAIGLPPSYTNSLLASP